MSKITTQEKVKSIFSDYLIKQGQRRTPERFSILEEVYSLNSHFDVDSLFLLMKAKKFKLSKATIYNTINLLLECNLITRHQFRKNQAQYEKSFEYKQHDHLICEDCERVVEFCDPRMHQIQSMMGEILKYKVTHHSLNLYGKCNQLAEKGKCEFYKEKK